ncbi:MAG: hypothetical protein EOO10_15515 [Chitinophagaceae bacterium]|nr:MAG: hypothetical protein EOO10_15515 [Chitinophagaceae bacterium]
MLLAFVSFSQKQFTLTELLQLNLLSTEQLTVELKSNGFGQVENSNDTFIRVLGFTNQQKQVISKAFLPNSTSSLTLHTPSPFPLEAFKKQLDSSGFALFNKNHLKGTYMEMYRKEKTTITITFPDDTEEGKILAFYLIAIVTPTK